MKVWDWVVLWPQLGDTVLEWTEKRGGGKKSLGGVMSKDLLDCCRGVHFIHSLGVCRIWWFLAVLRSFFHSSLSCIFSCHPFPPTILPSSLTSSCHLFLGPNSVGAVTHPSAQHPQRSPVFSTVGVTRVIPYELLVHVAHQLPRYPCNSLFCHTPHSPFLLVQTWPIVDPPPVTFENLPYSCLRVCELRRSRFRPILIAHFNATFSTFRGRFLQIGIRPRSSRVGFPTLRILGWSLPAQSKSFIKWGPLLPCFTEWHTAKNISRALCCHQVSVFY